MWNYVKNTFLERQGFTVFSYSNQIIIIIALKNISPCYWDAQKPETSTMGFVDAVPDIHRQRAPFMRIIK